MITVIGSRDPVEWFLTRPNVKETFFTNTSTSFIFPAVQETDPRTTKRLIEKREKKDEKKREKKRRQKKMDEIPGDERHLLYQRTITYRRLP